MDESTSDSIRYTHEEQWTMHVSLRIATPADAAAIRSIYAPYVESTAITFETEAPTTEEVTDRIELTHEQYPWMVCKIDDEGIVGL